MPNRIIKESICSSDDMASLSWFEQALFIRLIVTADDYGRMDARASIIRGKLFPLDDVRTEGIDKALSTLSAAGMIILYTVGGKPYLQLTAWAKHQSPPRAKVSKYPSLEDADTQLPTEACVCAQMQADDTDIRIRYSINGKRYSDAVNDTSCAEPVEDGSSPPVITLTLNDKSEYPISEELVEEWACLYPAVDVIQQLRSMKGWLNANPTKRKTKTGIKRFINGWLSREQDKGGSGATQAGGQQGGRRDPLDELRDLHDAFSAEEYGSPR
ncbi:MAG: hypothetical protein RR365_03925 [Bacteroides sp.]